MEDEMGKKDKRRTGMRSILAGKNIENGKWAIFNENFQNAGSTLSSKQGMDTQEAINLKLKYNKDDENTKN